MCHKIITSTRIFNRIFHQTVPKKRAGRETLYLDTLWSRVVWTSSFADCFLDSTRACQWTFRNLASAIPLASCLEILKHVIFQAYRGFSHFFHERCSFSFYTWFFPSILFILRVSQHIPFLSPARFPQGWHRWLCAVHPAAKQGISKKNKVSICLHLKRILKSRLENEQQRKPISKYHTSTTL